jgi:hypothetical protein
MSTYEFNESTTITRVVRVEASDLDDAEEKYANGEYEVSFSEATLEPAESDWSLDYVKEPGDEAGQR